MAEASDLEVHLALKHALQSYQTYDHQVKKLGKLQEKVLTGRPAEALTELSAKAAAKLLLSYEMALKSARSLQEHLHPA